jgi:hypothetical protein
MSTSWVRGNARSVPKSGAERRCDQQREAWVFLEFVRFLDGATFVATTRIGAVLQPAFPCCYNKFMTLMEITYELQSRLQPEQLRALGSFANTYGLRRFRVDEDANRLSFEYDASRLKETEVEHVLRQANIPVLRRVPPVGTISRV